MPHAQHPDLAGRAHRLLRLPGVRSSVRAQAPGATYLARWSLPSGRLLSTTRIDRAAVLAVGLVDAGARVARRRRATRQVFDARSLRRLSSVAITPALTAPSAAAISPDGRTIAVGSQTGQMSFINASTGDARPGRGPSSSSATNVAYSPDGRAVAARSEQQGDHLEPTAATPAEVLTIPGGQAQGVAFSPDGQTLYTSSVGGVCSNGT